jgi:hypothetical protein
VFGLLSPLGRRRRCINQALENPLRLPPALVTADALVTSDTSQLLGTELKRLGATYINRDDEAAIYSTFLEPPYLFHSL